MLCDVEQRFLDRGIAAITKNLDREVAKNKISAEDKASALKNIEPVTERARLAECDFIRGGSDGEVRNQDGNFRDLARLTRPEVILYE